MKIVTALVLSVLLACAACTPRHGAASLDTVGVLSEEVPTSPDAQLARFIGGGLEGGTASFSGTRFGSTASVTVGRPYTSALGLPCREAHALTGGVARQRIAACQQADGTWILAPNIFANGAF